MFFKIEIKIYFKAKLSLWIICRYKMGKNNIKSKNGLLKIYHSQPTDIDTTAVESNLRVQREWHREKLENALLHLNLDGKKVLDLACGSGGLTRKLKRICRSATIFGMDFNAKAISYAKTRDSGVKGLKYLVGDAENIPFKDNFFDIVIGLDMLDHIPDYKKSMREINRVLKKDGDVVLTVENHHSLWPVVEYLWYLRSYFGNARDLRHVHVVHFTPKTFNELIENTGFSVKKFYTIHNLNTFFYLVSDYYPKSLNSFISRKNLGLSLFCYAKKIKQIKPDGSI